MICLAPVDVTFSDVGQSSFDVDITPREGHPAVERYEATAVGAMSYSRSAAVLLHLCTVGCLVFRRARNTPYRLWRVFQDAQAADQRLYEKPEQV